MSIRYAKVTDIVLDVLTSGESESYQIVFTHHMNKSSYRDHMKLFLEKNKVWCIQFKKPFAHRYIILSGDFSNLLNVKYSSKTNARRNIQRRIVDIDVDIAYFEQSAAKAINFVSFNGYESNKQLNNYIESIEFIRKKLLKQRQTLHSTLLSPNVSYRAYPRLKA